MRESYIANLEKAASLLEALLKPPNELLIIHLRMDWLASLARPKGRVACPHRKGGGVRRVRVIGWL